MKHYKTKLDNGLTVLTVPMSNVKSVAINLLINVGGRAEQPAEYGIAHFLEHMAFKATKNRSTIQIAEEFDNIGGQFNAYTSKENTVYFSKVLNENIEKAVDIIADITQNSLYLEEEIAKECNVIHQEILQTHDNPDDLLFDNLYEASFKNQSLGASILGSKETIESFNKDNFQNFTAKHYVGDNMYLAAAGDIQHEQLVNLANKYFANIPQGEKSVVERANFTASKIAIDKADLEQAHIAIAYQGLPYSDLLPFYKAQMLSIVFGGGISSRLFQEIREIRGLAYNVGSFMSSYFDTGLFTIYAGTSADKIPELIEVIDQEITKICDGLTDKELARAKAQVKSSLIMAQERPAYKAEEIAKNYVNLGRHLDLEDVLNSIENITAKDLVDIAQQIFKGERSLSMIGNDVKKYSDLI